jgi:hypothetical protein
MRIYIGVYILNFNFPRFIYHHNLIEISPKIFDK